MKLNHIALWTTDLECSSKFWVEFFEAELSDRYESVNRLGFASRFATLPISTSLLELAGLGIFPWLFSEEFRQGYTDITCVVAPVAIQAGRVSSNSIVIETGSVQLVARGQVDWLNDSIAIRAEPRRVGKPLSRSAWPFDVTGQLSSPKFKLDVGGSRSKAPKGADEMPADRQPCVPDINQLE